jgi:hypothetical protein
MRQDLKKHVAAIHISGHLTLLQRKIANVLLFHAYGHLLTRDKHTINIGVLARMAGFDSNNYDALKDALRALTETTIEWDILLDGRSQWGVSTMLAEALIEAGICTYAYAPSLRERLYNPEIYARINLTIQAKFTSGHALALYENCVRFRKIGATGWISVDTLRHLLGVADCERYRSFKYLNDEVLKRSIKEVNAVTDIRITNEFKKEGRVVAAIKFNIESVGAADQETGGQKPIDGHPFGETGPVSDPTAMQRLLTFGLTRRQAEEVIAKRGAPYVVEVLDVVETAFQQGKVDNLAAFTVAALKQDYRRKTPSYADAQETQKRDQEKARQKAIAQQRERERLNLMRERQRLLEALDGLSIDERAAIENEFAESLTKENDILSRYLRRDGLQNVLVRGAFEAYARRRLLGES